MRNGRKQILKVMGFQRNLKSESKENNSNYHPKNNNNNKSE
jgi:hypothetical protein